ncbi:glycoside hydrolase [Solwaraspora sp. WMMD1047]|uniref:glycoside hydrolase family 30 protein n=1 Tax=Solwaraspora sp. WMMD1047 TaxID=3016102 RepID=UPI002417A692|nr:glycoside hydrolase [Solwaraspora sp. WMMD1047]MDG4829355.1 glycoside hydrolase [Solwaraspora sp. WMMD1047]
MEYPLVLRFRTALVTAVITGTVLATAPAHAHPPSGIDIDRRDRHQSIDGFGYSIAFQRASLVHKLSEAKRAEALDLLLDRRTGAAPSILRLGIGSSATEPYDLMLSIQPTDPGGPTAPPNYVWNGWDGGQVWFSKEAQKRGIGRFYADAWSAPGYMKDNGSDSNGGSLCGLQGVTCESGDWREAYARYLVQYTKFYRQEGIKIDELGFTNEPDWTAPYASMRFTPAQAAEFMKVIGPIAKRARVGVACCDSFGWTQSDAYAQAIEADPEARRHLAVFTGHGYASPSNRPLPTTAKTWMAEWAPSSVADGWNEAWDSGKGTDGIAVAERIHDTLALANSSAFIFWLGSSRGGTAALMQVDDANDAYRVSSRLWAFAAYSRFIRPGAVRVGVGSEIEGVKVSAYRNADGSEVVEILNTGTTEVATSVDMKRATAYLTDATHNLTKAPELVSKRGPHTRLTLPPRSLTTLVTNHPGRG